MHVILVVAGKEFRDGLRNRWIIAITVIFAILSVGLAYFGAAAAGRVGFTSLSTTVVSLASLAVFIIPLIALMLSYDGVVGDDENGTLLLLMTYPLSRWQLLLGKMTGHATIMAFSTILGFGTAAVVMGLFAEHQGWSEVIAAFAIFILSATLLGWVFIAIAYIISSLVTEKSKAAGLALITWFLLVLVFDLGILGLLVATEGNVDAELFPYLLLANPTDIFRLVTINYFASENITGLMAIARHVQFSTLGLLLCLFAWLIALISIALTLFNRRSL